MPHLRETSKNHDHVGPGILRAVGLAELRLKSLSSMGIKNICEILRKNLKKYLQSAKPYGIIIKRDCNRYAMMREVAVQRDGEFPRSMSDLKPGGFHTEMITAGELPKGKISQRIFAV